MVENKILTDKEFEYFQRSLKAFVHEISERFNISKEGVVYKLQRELKLMEVGGEK